MFTSKFPCFATVFVLTSIQLLLLLALSSYGRIITRDIERISRQLISSEEMVSHASHGRLCATDTKPVELKSTGLYEYRPRYYTEVRCRNAILNGADIFVDRKNGHCSTLNMHCVQQYRIMQLMRKRMDESMDVCWEPALMEIKIPYGCECMYPLSEIAFGQDEPLQMGEL